MTPRTTLGSAKAWMRQLPPGAPSIFGLHLVSLVCLMAASIPVARHLGPAQKGVINLFTLLTGLISEFGLVGLNSGLLYQLGNRRVPIGTVHAAALQGCALLGGLSVLLLLGLRPLLSHIFDGLPGTFLLLAAVMAPLLFYRTLWSSLMTGIEQVTRVYRVNATFAVGSLAAVSLLWWSRCLTVERIIWLTALMVVAYCVHGFLVLGALHRFRFVARYTSLRDALRYGAVVHVGVICNFLHFRGDQMLVNYFEGPRGLGIYTVSVACAELLWLVDYAVMNTAVYRISSSEPRASWQYTLATFRLTLAILTAGAVLLAAAAPLLVRCLYGPQFGEAVLPLLLLLPGVVAWGSGRILAQFISYNAGRPSLTSAAAALGCTVNVLANLYAIPHWGIAGASAASSVSYAATLAAVAAVFFASGRRLEACGSR
jgi:O-antigen/teichoic acid export membrane protein